MAGGMISYFFVSFPEVFRFHAKLVMNKGTEVDNLVGKIKRFRPIHVVFQNFGIGMLEMGSAAGAKGNYIVIL